MHKNKKRSIKYLLLLLVVAFLIFAFAVWFLLFGSYTLHGKKYIDHSGDYLCSVELEKYGKYEDYKFQRHTENMAIWTAESWAITLEYNDENFAKQIENINSNTEFMPELLTDSNGNKFRIPNQAKINGWAVKMVGVNELIEDYPHHIEIIAYNNKENKIVYIDFYDGDLDFIDSLDDFINNYCGYKL